tara:strand:- start:55 stop:1077 length:1023 start_codon:yes stop_codon:yes gene_type:complete
MEPDSFTKTSFCNVQIDNITTNEAKQYILNQMSIFCSGIKFNSRYAKVYNDQYSKNLKNPHIFCLKSSGTPYLLFLSQINDTNYCFLIDKKTNEKYPFPKIMVTPYDFSPELYKGTLFECELIRDKENNWSLSINDIYYHKGKNMNKTIIIDRLNIIHSLFMNDFKETDYSKVCPIFVKKYFDYKDVKDTYENFIPNLPYNTRGLYFVPLRTDYSKILYLFSRDQSLVSDKKNEFNKSKKNHVNYKKKYSKEEKEKKTIFRIVKTLKPDVYELYLKEGDNLVKQGNALVQTIETSHKILEFFKDKDPMDEIKVECKLNLDFNKWVPICQSKDEITSVYDL